MSKKHSNACGCECAAVGYNYYATGNYEMEKGSCICNFPTLIILILIILQFDKKRSHGSKIDNSILFIIALFFLSCNNPCKKWY
ncbi:hypothetical protein [Clostridium oryzae]|uniref:Uncharacterized protein n=1 Tax=Clostridium oryzae TaxID=1450648 RepID=A0A1V4I5U5_9CLOT|nr:hypothetical protein [Clostridium oryzae]OPJ55342.1 hypothetical protein CLORY_44340 [Clostridium oryzae]